MYSSSRTSVRLAYRAAGLGAFPGQRVQPGWGHPLLLDEPLRVLAVALGRGSVVSSGQPRSSVASAKASTGRSLGTERA
jgi:hypothetical protein